MYPLHRDMLLTDEQKQIVLDYIREVNFAIPGTTPEDYRVVDVARYVGWNFQKEDLEAYAVGLQCTKPGFEKHNTFIRMSRDQLLAVAEAKRLPVNEPVLASDMMRMQRWRDTPVGPGRTGVDSYAEADGSIPGVDMDLTMLEDTLTDIHQFNDGTIADKLLVQFDFAVDWGTLLAGRYPRLKHFESEGKLRPDQVQRLHAFEARAAESEEVLRKQGLTTLECLKTPENRRHRQHNKIKL